MNNKQKILLFTYWALILLGLIFLSCSCAASKRSKPCQQCPHYSELVLPIVVMDTFVVFIPHHNYNNICYPARKIRCIDSDTIYVENLYKPKQR